MENEILENTLKALDIILPWVVIALGISLMVFFLASALYSFVYYQKKANLKKSKELVEENRRIIQDADFIHYNDKYTNIIRKQIEEITQLTKEAKALRAERDELEIDVKRDKKDPAKKRIRKAAAKAAEDNKEKS